MSERVFDRDTLLDLTVNIIPLALLAVFFVGYIVVNPFGFDTVVSTIQLAIIGVSALILAVLTYYSGKAVSKAEKSDNEGDGTIEATDEAATEPTPSDES